MEARDYIRKKEGDGEILCRLAKHAAELSQAALTYREEMCQDSGDDRWGEMLDALGRVWACMHVVTDNPADIDVIWDITEINAKLHLKQWAGRLMVKEEDDEEEDD